MSQIRKYKSEDQVQVIALFRQNAPAYFSLDEEPDLIKYLNEEIEEYFVLEHNEEIIGCGGINFNLTEHKGIISWDIVSNKHHGKGIGSKLLKHRLDLLKQHKGVKTIIVRTSQHVFPFYEKHGFDLKFKTKDYWDKGFDLYHMEIEKQA